MIPNSSFEVYSSCPNTYGQIFKATPWYDPNGGTSDYFNFCATDTVGVPLNDLGYQNARTGNAYAGFYVYISAFTSYREYIQVLLIDSLSAGMVYRVSFYVSPSDILRFSVDQVGACLTETAISCSPASSCIINYTPQVENTVGNIITDTANWTLITGTFTAIGGEKYITIGNFKADSLTQTYVINSNSTYTGAYFFIDDVSIYPDSVTGIEELTATRFNFKVFPNPNNGKMTLDYNIEEDGGLHIWDITGKLISTYPLNKQNHTHQINDEGIGNGIYYYTIVIKNNKVFTDKLVIIK